MRRLKLNYLIPAVMTCALFAGSPTNAKAAFLFFGDSDETRPVISRVEAQSLARGVVPGNIESTRVISDGGQTVSLIDVNYRDRMHAVTVDGETGHVVADRIGRGKMFPFSLF